ncbi:MAG: tetratricopeptide repeat protein [Gemmataceae bacterium]
MSAEPRSIKELFLEALSAPAEDRARWLEEACRNDPHQRELLVKMLAAHNAPQPLFDQFLPITVADRGDRRFATVTAPRTSETAGVAIGPYTLVEPLGEGGSATVWLARQQGPIERQVALKVIHSALMSRQALARSKVEVQALAVVDHPNIARVLDAGATVDGRPYLVMELVRGVPITRYCDEHRLAVDDRLRLFLMVCRAVEHAHIKGVIHRDLKPTNVLVGRVDGLPKVKVIDFSIAKVVGQPLTAPPATTAVGTLVGTLEYMSPEQAKLDNVDIDIRTDVYSLGVLLHELLTGTTPLAGAKLEAPLLDVLRAIREEEPLRPSARLTGQAARTVRGDLDCIVLKAIEKERSRRYQSAGELAADVARYLAEEPILARPPSAAYRLGKLARRHKGRLAVAVTLTLAFLVAAAGVGWAVRDRAAVRADADRARADRVSRLAARVELVLAELDRLARDQQWDAALAAARNAEAVIGEGEPADDTRAAVAAAVRELELARELDRIRTAASVWKEGAFDFAGADRAYGETFCRFGVDVESLPCADAVARLVPHSRIVAAVAVALDHWTFVRRRKGNDSKATAPLIELANRLDPDPLRTRLRHVGRRETDPAVQAELRQLVESVNARDQSPTTLGILAAALSRAGLVELEERVLREAQSQHPDDFWVNLQLANLMRGRKGAAAEVQFCRVTVALRPTSTAALNNLGFALLDQGQHTEAVACFRQATALDPQFVIGHRNLSRALERMGDLDGAVAATRRAANVEPRDIAHLDNLARLLARQRNHTEALASLQKAIEIAPDNSYLHNNLGLTLLDLGRLDAGTAAFRKAVALDPKNHRAHTNLGTALAGQRQLNEAVAAHRAAIAVNPTAASTHDGLGCALAMQGKAREAVASFRKAIELDPKLPAAHRNLGQGLVYLGDLEGAAAAYRKAAELEPSHAPTANNLAFVLLKLGKADEAVPWFRKAVELGPRAPRTHYNLGFVLERQGKREEAQACYRKALDLIRPRVKERPTADSLETLAEAAARCQAWREAADAREQLARLRPPKPSDKLYLAMAHWRAGNQAAARKWHAEALGDLARLATLEPRLAALKKEVDGLVNAPPTAKAPSPPDAPRSSPMP